MNLANYKKNWDATASTGVVRLWSKDYLGAKTI